MTAIQIVAKRGVDAAVLSALLEAGADPFAKTTGGSDSFVLALACGNMNNLGILLKHVLGDSDASRRNHWLANWVRKSGVSWPLDHGGTVFAIYLAAIQDAGLTHTLDKNGHGLLFYAAGRGNQQLADSLLRLGANPNLADPFGWTPLHEAVRSGRQALIKLLSSYGADIHGRVSSLEPYPNTCDHNAGIQIPSLNCLHLAVLGRSPNSPELAVLGRSRNGPDLKCGSPEILHLLLELGINPNEKIRNIDSLGLDKAHSIVKDETLLKVMFFCNSQFAWTPNFFEIVQTLLEFGGDARGIAEQMSPAIVARFAGYEHVWETLRTAGLDREEEEGSIISH